MNNKSLWFELFSIAFLLVSGLSLLQHDLPGWGVINMAILLSVLSFSLRQFSPTQTATSPA